MATIVQLRSGEATYDLVYDSGTQDDYKVQYGLSVTPGEAVVTWHNPDDSPPIPIRAYDPNRTAVLTMSVYGTNWDDVQNTLNPIKLLVDGANSKALRHNTIGDVDSVVLRLQQDGATNYIDIPILSGYVDDSGSFFTPAAVLNKIALGVVLILEIAPYGDAPSFEVINELTGSAAFLDTGTGGLAEGWQSSGVGSPTFALVSNPALIGGQSQELTLSAVNEGCEVSTAHDSTPSAYALFYLWVNVGTFEGTLRVYAELHTGIKVASVSFTHLDIASIAQTSSVDGQGNTWYQIGSNAWLLNSNAVRLGIDCTAVTTAGTVYIDKAYYRHGITGSFYSWTSSWGGSGSLNAGVNNYIDIAGPQGDAPAKLRIKITAGTLALKKRIVLGRWIDTYYSVVDFNGFIESNHADWGYGTGWTDGTGETANHYKRFTSSGTAVTFSISFVGVEARAILANPKRVFARMRTNDITSSVIGGYYIGTSNGGVASGDSEETTISTANSWEYVDLGVITGSNATPISAFWSSTSPSLRIEFTIDVPNTKTFDIDFVDILPTEEFLDHTMKDVSFDYIASQNGWIDPDTKMILLSGVAEKPAGRMWEVSPNVLSRVYFRFLYQSSSNNPAVTFSTATLTETFTVIPEITPRVRHLIGTI